MKDLYGIDWIVMALNLYSYYLIGCKKPKGFLLGFIGSVIGIVLFISMKSPALVIMYGAFGILNLINYVKWRILMVL